MKPKTTKELVEKALKYNGKAGIIELARRLKRPQGEVEEALDELRAEQEIEFTGQGFYVSKYPVPRKDSQLLDFPEEGQAGGGSFSRSIHDGEPLPDTVLKYLQNGHTYFTH
jgi:hypothetical protein